MSMSGGNQDVHFPEFFEKAVGCQPFGFQTNFARELPSLVDVPTGLGKTAMAIIGWLWRRFAAGDEIRRQTPRRLVYCLPMRVLVEQSRDNAIRWLYNLGRLGGDVTFDQPPNAGQRATPKHYGTKYAPSADKPGTVAVYTLMGGEDEDEWDIHPERDAIIVGTQDMLLSRALNRGYAANRARWPMQFGLLNTECLWVFDEIQLMGSGLATTAQLDAFRRKLPDENTGLAKNGHGCRSVWMSATLDAKWLETVDFRAFLLKEPRLSFDFQSEIASLDINTEAKQALRQRWHARKPLSRASAAIGDLEGLAKQIVTNHKKRRGLTLVVVNTVRRAQELHQAIKNQLSGDAAARLVLLHSRFRPPDRDRKVRDLLDPKLNRDMICVSTQVVEAGVDVDARTLFTELAPWASLVQRFGRCNRRGDWDNEDGSTVASVRWIDLPSDKAKADRVRLPYELADLQAAANQLKNLKDVGLESLANHAKSLSEDERKTLFAHDHAHVIRRRDLIDLFDTTPDLAGNDIDIDRYIREVEETDVRVFWRTWEGDEPPDDKHWRRFGRDELCPAPIGEFKDFATKGKGKGTVWHWDFTEGRWQRVEDKDAIYPGQVYLVRTGTNKDGAATTPGYDATHGWGNDRDGAATNLGPFKAEPRGDDEYDDDGLSMTDQFESIAEHTEKVCKHLKDIITVLDIPEATTLCVAARWHDWGKAHDKFQIKIDDGQPLADSDQDGNPQFRRPRDGKWAQWAGRRDVAKAPDKRWNRDGKLEDEGFWFEGGKAKDGFRRHFRHELASALGVLQRGHESLRALSDEDLNLVAYLIAAHHGKVRLSIRSLPNELRPRDRDGKPVLGCRFARGVWDGDELPETDLGQDEQGNRIIAPKVTLSLEPMELGLCEEPPFAGQPSWAERMIRLRNTLGPFRLAYLEALLRAADMRASKAAGQHAATHQTVGSTADDQEADRG